MRAPTRALIVEDVEEWSYTLSRAARRAGVSEVVVCENLPAVHDALRKARFDVAILDVGLDPYDEVNSDGIKALEAIREIDDGGTRCVLVTGWQGGDRMALQAEAEQRFGIDFAYMKEKYEARVVIAKLTELLEDATARRLSSTTPMENLGAKMEAWQFQGELIGTLSPSGGVQTLYSLVSRVVSSAVPVVAMHPTAPMGKGPDGVWTGVYWSRALAAAVAVSLGPISAWEKEDSSVPSDLGRLLPTGALPDLIEDIRERNIQGRLWELPWLERDKFPE